MGKYTVTSSQGLFQPNSNDKVLVNKLAITEPAEMDEAELFLLGKLYEEILLNNLPQEVITIATIKTWHRRWLGNVYEWAGADRSVNMSKSDFHFAAVTQILQQLNQFELDYLRRYTPCMELRGKELIEAIAVIHIEFILIHPFRDGNGRLSRLLADVMAVQAGYPPLDYTAWDKNKKEYFTAIQHGVNRNYEPMKQWISKALSEV